MKINFSRNGRASVACLSLAFVSIGIIVLLRTSTPEADEVGRAHSPSVVAASSEVHERLKESEEQGAEAAATSEDRRAAVVDVTFADDRGAVRLFSADGDFGRIFVEPSERVRLELSLPPALNQPHLRISAPHGGVINGEGASVVVKRSTDDPTVEFDFQAGLHRGRYPVEIESGNRFVQIEFWAGPEIPPGEPGPTRNFSYAPRN